MKFHVLSDSVAVLFYFYRIKNYWSFFIASERVFCFFINCFQVKNLFWFIFSSVISISIILLLNKFFTLKSLKALGFTNNSKFWKIIILFTFTGRMWRVIILLKIVHFLIYKVIIFTLCSKIIQGHLIYMSFQEHDGSHYELYCHDPNIQL